jgi:cytochrome c-type biogenesis protein CcmH/NrfG
MKPFDTMLMDTARRSLALKNAGQWDEAAPGFEELLAVQPDWEHGYGWFNLAECYEEIGRTGDAGVAYRKAELLSPTDSIIVGGRASFLYLHGEPIEAIDQHIRLLLLDRLNSDQSAADTTMVALAALAARLGWSEEHLAQHIEKRLPELTAPTPD